MSANANTLTCLPNEQLRAQGMAVLRVAADLEGFLKDEEVPDSLREDLRQMKAVGEWLVRSTTIDLTTLRTSGIPSGGHLATGFPSATGESVTAGYMS